MTVTSHMSVTVYELEHRLMTNMNVKAQGSYLSCSGLIKKASLTFWVSP